MLRSRAQRPHCSEAYIWHSQWITALQLELRWPKADCVKSSQMFFLAHENLPFFLKMVLLWIIFRWFATFFKNRNAEKVEKHTKGLKSTANAEFGVDKVWSSRRQRALVLNVTLMVHIYTHFQRSTKVMCACVCVCAVSPHCSCLVLCHL